MGRKPIFQLIGIVFEKTETAASIKPHGTRRQMFGIGAGLLADGSILAAQDRPPAEESVMQMPFERRDPVRFGIIGLGNRGSLMLDLLLAVPRARVTAVCDIVPEKTSQARDRRSGHPGNPCRRATASPLCPTFRPSRSRGSAL